MQFNDTTNLSGAIQECEAWLFGGNYGTISNNPTLLKRFTSLINEGNNDTIIELFKSDGRWKYDDRNNDNIPRATTDLADGVRNYLLENSHLKVYGFEVKDNQGNFYPIRPIDFSEIRLSGQSESEFFETSGKPMLYDLDGDVVKLYPAPKASDVTLSDGLRIVYQDGPALFSTTDTTKEFGLPKPFHSMPVLLACSRYAKQNSMQDKARELDAEIERKRVDIKDFISKRNNEDMRPRIRPAYRSAK